MKFKCIHTGNVYEFTEMQDINTMKLHPEYEVVVEEAPKSADGEATKPAKKS